MTPGETGRPLKGVWTVSNEVLVGAAYGLMVGMLFGGFFLLVLALIAWIRRRLGKPGSMKRVWLWMGGGFVACVCLSALGFQGFGATALVVAAIGGYTSLGRSMNRRQHQRSRTFPHVLGFPVRGAAYVQW